jgi:hypothetical protein
MSAIEKSEKRMDGMEREREISPNYASKICEKQIKYSQNIHLTI